MKAEAETDSVRFRLVGHFLFSYMVNFHTSSATVIVRDVQLWSEWGEVEGRYKVTRYSSFETVTLQIPAQWTAKNNKCCRSYRESKIKNNGFLTDNYVDLFFFC